MATWLGTVQFDTYASYELAYDLLGQNAQGNYSTVRFQAKRITRQIPDGRPGIHG